MTGVQTCALPILYRIREEQILSFDTPGMGLSTSLGASSPVYEIARYKNRIWFVTPQGFARYDLKTSNWRTYTAPVLPLTPRGMVVNARGVWVGTEQGLRVLNPTTGLWELYTKQDGLASNFITAVTATSNYIWAGSDRGLTRIDLKGIRTP